MDPLVEGAGLPVRRGGAAQARNAEAGNAEAGAQKESSEASVAHSGEEEEDGSPHTAQAGQPAEPAAAGAAKKTRKRKSPSWKLRTLTFKDLQRHFDKPLHVAAQILDVSDNGLKKLCRERQIERWPYREIQGLRNTITHLEDVMGKSNSTQEKHKIHDLLATLQGQEQYLFDTGKCRDHAAALADISPPASAASRPFRIGTGIGQSEAALASFSSSLVAPGASTWSVGALSPPTVPPALAEAGTSRQLGETSGLALKPVQETRCGTGGQGLNPSMGVSPPLAQLPGQLNAMEDPQSQRLVWTVMEQLALIADGQRSLAARVARLEGMLDTHFHHREGGRNVAHPGPSPAFPHSHHHHASHLLPASAAAINMPGMAAGSSAPNGMNAQLGTYYQFQHRPNLVGPSMHGYPQPGHPLSHTPYL